MPFLHGVGPAKDVLGISNRYLNPFLVAAEFLAESTAGGHGDDASHLFEDGNRSPF